MGNPLAYKLLSGTSPAWDVLYKLALITATGNTTITLSGANTDADGGTLGFIQGGSGDYTLEIVGWDQPIQVRGAVGAKTTVQWAYVGGELFVVSDYVTGASLTQLSAPGSFTATTVSNSQINLTWTDVPNETNYLIQRSPAGAGTWSDINSPAAGATSYNNTGLSASTDYDYRIKAVGDGVTYSDSSWATVSASTWGTLLVEDTFDAADISDINGRTTTTGSKTWTPLSGNTGTVGITSNQAKLNTLDTNAAYVFDAGVRDIGLHFTLGIKNTGVGVFPFGWAYLAYTDSNNYFICYLPTGELYKKVGGTQTQLFAGSGSSASVSEGMVVRLELDGNSLRYYRAANLIHEADVTGVALTGTKCGMLWAADNTSTIDKISVYSV